MEPNADIALIGLAVMGQNLVLNMNDHGFKVAVFNRTVSKVDEFLAKEAKGTNVLGAHSIEELVKQLITAAHKHQKAVINLTPTVHALQERRVWQLVYADGFAPAGTQCVNCLALYAEEKEACDYCGQAVKGVSDFIDRAAERVLEMDGSVEQVRGAAAERLEKEGSIGALLRF